jgi:protein SCO1
VAAVPLVRRVALALALVAACTACGAKHVTYRGFVIKPAAVVPDFTLHDQSGKPVGPQNVRGRWLVIAFLYTHCPDVCPLIANSLSVAQRQLPDLRVLAVSVDPTGDTPMSVRHFIALHRLPSRFRYLTGTRATLRAVWKAYHVASAPGPKGTVSHSTFELLIDPKGRSRLLYDSTLRANDLVHDLRELS